MEGPKDMEDYFERMRPQLEAAEAFGRKYGHLIQVPDFGPDMALYEGCLSRVKDDLPELPNSLLSTIIHYLHKGESLEEANRLAQVRMARLIAESEIDCLLLDYAHEIEIDDNLIDRAWLAYNELGLPED